MKSQKPKLARAANLALGSSEQEPALTRSPTAPPPADNDLQDAFARCDSCRR
jgi:hypothetical protein